MRDRKNIDKIFDEGLKNFQPAPSTQVWENIEAELNKGKRNRKPIPLWIKYGSVAAVLALLLTVGGFVYKSVDTLPNSITNENFIDPAERLNGEDNNLDSVPSHIPVATDQENINNAPFSEINNIVDISSDNSIKASKETPHVVGTAEGIENRTIKSKGNQLQDTTDQNTQQNGYENRIAGSDPISESPGSKAVLENSTERTDHKRFFDPVKEGLETSDKRISATEIPAHLAENPRTDILKIEDSIIVSPKKSILEAIAQNEEEDSNMKNVRQPESRWSIGPNVAPVYYGGMGNGSSIDPDFTNNPQKGDVNMSYGLKVSYALNNRLSIRTGIQNMDLSYSTADIVIGTGPVAMALESIDYGSRQIVVTAVSREKLSVNNGANNGFENLTLKST